VLAHHRALIALRHASVTVQRGDFTMLLPDHDDVYAFTRALDGETLLVVCNVSATPYALDELLPEAVGADPVLGNLADPDPRRLGPWDARVLRLR
jgi:oligo-1,6-glucosidase